MKKLTQIIIVCIAVMGWVAGSTLSQAAASTNQPLKILKQPKSRMAEKGTHVDFTVVATNSGYSLTYQWQRNGRNIPEATKKSYCIENVQMTDVATYTVIVTGNGSKKSKPAHLSVYTLICTNSTFGTLVTPIGLFAGPSYTCPNDGTFQKGYCPTDAYGVVQLFYGPNASPQSGPFQNTQSLPTLKVDTFSSSNGTADTGIRIRNNWVPYSNACCNDDTAGGTDPKQSKCSITLSPNKTYKVIILYKDPPGAPAGGTVTFNWLYQ